jgi:hypothetical protein
MIISVQIFTHLIREGARFHLIGSKRKKKGLNIQWEIQIWPQGDWVGAIVELLYLKELFSRAKNPSSSD